MTNRILASLLALSIWWGNANLAYVDERRVESILEGSVDGIKTELKEIVDHKIDERIQELQESIVSQVDRKLETLEKAITGMKTIETKVENIEKRLEAFESLEKGLVDRIRLFDVALVDCNKSNNCVRLNSFGSSSYFIVKNSKTWSVARSLCQSLGGDLASFAGDSEWRHVYAERKRVNPQNWHWIGGKKNGGTWKWMTGEVIGMERMAWNTDKNRAGECLRSLQPGSYTVSNMWYPASCSSLQYSTCEFH